VSALEAALAGKADRPLLAPLFAALAAEVEQLDVDAFLADPGRRARIYADLARSLRPDILVVDSGSGWDAPSGVAGPSGGAGASGVAGGSGPAGASGVAGASGAADPGVALVADLLRRVRAVVPPPTALGVTVTGPATRGEPLAAAVQATLAAARGAAEAGATVIFVDERVESPPDGYARALTPLWGSLQFFRAVGVLKATWSGELPKGPFLPCVTAPIDAPHALAVPPVEAARPTAATTLITHTEDLAGYVPVRELRSAIDRLRAGRT
jgi:hypothetical protein